MKPGNEIETRALFAVKRNCGAMKGLMKLNQLREEMPLVHDWLKYAEATRRLVKDHYSQYQGEELLEIVIAENVLTQIENLRTYPVIRSKLYQGQLNISNRTRNNALRYNTGRRNL
jgi:carbonic anhydrase